MLLKNVKIVNHDSIIENANINIENGTIVNIEKIEGKPSAIVVPGFIDVHIHGYFGFDSMGTKEDVERMSEELKKVGTTGFLATTATQSIPTLKKCLENITNATSVGATILGVHMEGPFLSQAKKGAQNADYILVPTPELIDDLQKTAKGKIKKMTIAPEHFPDEALGALQKNDIVISIGHTSATYNDAMRTLKFGVSSCTHLWNAMTGVLNRNPGVVEFALNHRQIFAELILDLHHVDEPAINLSVIAKGTDRIVAVSDALSPAGLGEGEFMFAGLAIERKGKLFYLKGQDTISGSASTMHDCFLNALKIGYTLENAVAFTSYNAAVNLKLKDLGEVAVNKKASLVIMDHDFKIKQVLVDGK